MIKNVVMENVNWQKKSIDDLVFEGRNKSYGAYLIRRIYDKHMARAMTVGILFFILAVSAPQIIRMTSPDPASDHHGCRLGRRLRFQ